MSRPHLIGAVAACVLLVGSAAAGAHERPATDAYPDVKVTGDCGCTGAARAKSRVEQGLVHTPAATAATAGG